MEENIHITEAMNKFGEDIIKEMINQLIQAGKNNTGTLIDSLKYRYQETAKGLELLVYGADYAEYVDKGRKPGKYPPLNSIKQYCRSRGIPESAAFPIAKKIFKFGIKPTNFISKSIEIVLEKDKENIANNIGQDIIINLKKTLELGSK